MMPWNSPSSTERLTSSSTTRSPKRTWISRASRMVMPLAFERMGKSGGTPQPQGLDIQSAPPGLEGSCDPLGTEQHHDDEEETEPEHPGGRDRADHVPRHEEHHHADHRPPEAHEPAADQHHHDNVARMVQAHHVRK